MNDEATISATVSAATKEKLDRFTRATGLEEGYVVEQAVLCFIEAQREMADGAFIPARLVLADAAFDRVVTLLTDDARPTAALRRLLHDEG